MLRTQHRFSSEYKKKTKLMWIDNIKNMKEEIENKRRRKLISNYRDNLEKLRNIGFSNSRSKSIYNNALNNSKLINEKLYAEEINKQVEKELNHLIMNLNSIPLENREYTEKKAFFIPSPTDSIIKADYFVSIKTNNERVFETKELSSFYTKILKYISDNNIDSKELLTVSVVEDKNVQHTIDLLEEKLNCFIDIDEIRIIEHIENEDFFVQNYIYPDNLFIASGIFTLNKNTDKIKATKAANKILMHIVNKNPLSIKEGDLPESICKIEKKRINNKNYNKFLTKSVLHKQFLTSDPEYYQEDLNEIYTIEERKSKKKINVEDYLKENGINIVQFIRV